MKVLTKKEKQDRISKIMSYHEKYPVIHIVHNNNIPTESIQKLRTIVEDGKVLFIRKNIIKKMFASFNYSENFFLIFSKKDISDLLSKYEYSCFIKAGETVHNNVIIPAGILKYKNIVIDSAKPQGSNFILETPYVVCNDGDLVTEEQAEILRAMGLKYGTTHLEVIDVKHELELNK